MTSHAPKPPSATAAPRQRLQRFLADAGVAARRVCESMIEDGRVKVNGATVRTLPAFVGPTDKVEVDNRLIRPPAPPVYIMLNKPERVLVSTVDEPGLERTKVVDLVRHALAPRLFPVGRLEWDAQGLLLLTNDGDFANRITHPKFGMPKVYRVQVKGEVTPSHLSAVRRQARLLSKRDAAIRRQAAKELAGGAPLPKSARGKRPGGFVPPYVRMIPGIVAAAGNDNPEARKAQGTTLEITLLEAGQAPLREVLLAAGLSVRRLTRVGIGHLRLGQLPVGDWRELTKQELRELVSMAPWTPPPPSAAAQAGVGPAGIPDPAPAKQRANSKQRRPGGRWEKGKDARASQAGKSSGPRGSVEPRAPAPPAPAPPAAPKPKLGRRQPRTLLPE